MKKILLYVLLFFKTNAASEINEFDPSQVREDIQYLQKELVKYHPGLYRYTPVNSMEFFFQEAMQTESSIDDYNLYSRITFLLSKVGCGHTRSRMSDRMRSTFEQDQLFIPFTIKVLNEKVYVNKSLVEHLQPGDEIISINDMLIKQIQTILYSHQPADGWITTGKERRTELLFDAYYQLFVEPKARSYELKLKKQDGRPVKHVVDGVSFDEINAIRNSFPDEEFLSLDRNEDYAYMRIRTFGSSALQQRGLDYEEFLQTSFKELKQKNTKNLILDLRGNSGGKDNYGALLVSYLAKSPFKYFERIEVTKDYPGRSRKTEDTYLMTNHEGLSSWYPDENSFEGEIYVLIDGFSFSTCADVATVLHHHQWATFIGEETGGGYDGNTSGHTRTITLPNSKVTVNVPMWKYTTANIGHSFPGRGVIPDYALSPTWGEYSEGKDVVLEKALALMQ